MRNRWTGGQYSVYRALLGICVVVLFLRSGFSVTTPIAVTAACLLVIGMFDRVAAVIILGVLAYVQERDVALMIVAWLLIAHLFIPPAPYGSWAARNRIDPRGGWTMPFVPYLATWLVFGVLGVWVPRFASRRRDRVLYDGTCGLCHRTVRFIVAEDIAAGFTFSPLPPDLAQESVLVEAEDGRRLDRSDAARYILARLGGMWRIASILLGAIPRPVRDWGYDVIARVRYRLFRRPKDVCPILPPDLRSRFTI